MNSKVQLVIVSCPETHAVELAELLVKEKLAACVNIVPGVQSVYRWQGAIEKDSETLLLIKCAAAKYPSLETRVLEVHPYELPEIVTVSELGGLEGYLEWVRNPE
jgi:periplasmic divalent cation tolerance protein